MSKIVSPKVDWDKVAKIALKAIHDRKVHETDKYIISVENIDKPLNYIIYPKVKGKLITSGKRFGKIYRF